MSTSAYGMTVANTVVTASDGVLALAWLIPTIPLIGFVAVLLATKRLGDKSAGISIGAAALTFGVALAVAAEVLRNPATYIRELPTWISVGGFDVRFDLLIDQLTVVMLLVVTGVGLLIHLYSVGYMHGDSRYPRYFAYLNLFLASMLVLILGSNLLTLFLGWELVGLSSYLLIGFWFERANYASAAKKAFITNRVGDVAFMVAMFVTFITFGTLDLLAIIDNAEILASTTAFVLVLLFMAAAAAKSAQIPLYVWLPDAMAGPTPVSALIHAATMVTAGVYLTVRLSSLLVLAPNAMLIIAWIGALTALFAALIAVRQDDIKKILAYSTVSQLGFMFIGVGVGAFREAIFHLVTHAFFKGLLFLAAGSVMHAMANRTNIYEMGGLRRAMPITFATSAIGWLAISGIPPFAGFFSKDQILTEAYLHGFGGVYVIGVIAAILTAYYMTRWFVLVFLGTPRWPDGVDPHESPRSMTAPLMILAAASAIGGLALNPVHTGPLYRFLAPVVAPITDLGYTPVGPWTEVILIPLAIVAAVAGILIAVFTLRGRNLNDPATREIVRGPVGRVLENKFYVDEAYAAVFVTGGSRLGRALQVIDTRVLDGVVNGAGTVTTKMAGYVRGAQTGLVRNYVYVLVAGMLVITAYMMILAR
ncbi:MAG: NADH-quinone oxidoreductase subunit L [Nitriliruptoraceae bacterium]